MPAGPLQAARTFLLLRPEEAVCTGSALVAMSDVARAQSNLDLLDVVTAGRLDSHSQTMPKSALPTPVRPGQVVDGANQAAAVVDPRRVARSPPLAVRSEQPLAAQHRQVVLAFC